MSDYPDRTQLQQIIASIREGVILIERDRAITYANRAALVMHGVGSLDELGRDVGAYRRNVAVRARGGAALGQGETPIERVADGEVFEDALVELVHRAQPDLVWVHQIRSLVVTTSDGAHDCSALVITDVSDLVEAEERFGRMFEANPAPAAICRLLDLTWAKVNQGFLDLTGFARDDVIGRTIYEVDALERAERRDEAIRCLMAGRTIPQMEACLTVPRDAERWVIVAGQPVEIGAEPFMLFTFADLEDRRKAELALAESEERFATAFRLLPIPASIAAEDGPFLDVNDAFVRALGHAPEAVTGRTAEVLGLWAEPETAQRFRAALAAQGSVRDFEARLRGGTGAAIDVLVSAERVTINGRACVLSAFLDVTERRRSEAELAAAIEQAMADTTWVTRGVIEKLAALRPTAGTADSGARLEDLSAREREILGLICRGAGDAAMSRALNLSPHTIRNHVASLYRKLGVNRRSQVVIWARERGFDPDPRPSRAKK